MTGSRGRHRLGDFRLLSFDTFGTLIDWETGIASGLADLARSASPVPSRDQLLEKYAVVEARLEAELPRARYRDLLAEAHRRLSEQWFVAPDPEAAARFSESIGDWPAFPDAPAALAELRNSFLVVTLTNCDRISYMGSNRRLGIEWDAVITAEDVGSYKPDRRNFEHLLETVRDLFSILPREILHVAQSLTHDMVPATELGLATAWINRRHDQEGYGATPVPTGQYRLDFEFPSMDALVAAHRSELEGARRGGDRLADSEP